MKTALVAAIGDGVMDLHKRFGGALDLVGLRRSLEPQSLEVAAVWLLRLDRARGLLPTRISPR